MKTNFFLVQLSNVVNTNISNNSAVKDGGPGMAVGVKVILVVAH